MCLAASAVYLVNDVVDRDRDRHHPRKKDRPIAAGAIGAGAALVVAVILAALAAGLAYCATPDAALGIAVYLGASLAYCLLLRRLAMVDLFALAGLYTVRLVVGGLATGIAVSPWLGAFALFIFLSLSCAKRHAELRLARGGDGGDAPGAVATDRFGRDYRPADAPLLLALGVANAVASAVILAIYLFVEVDHHYRHPLRLYPALPLELLWISRLWLFAARGRLDLDPIAFALRDPTTLVIAATIVVLGVCSA
jgi:4-hydroxybenzoate polyprenyltransferase